MTFYAFCVVLAMCFYNAHCGLTYECKIPSGSGVSSMPRKCTEANKSHKVGPFFILESLGTVNTFHSDKMVAWSLGRGLLKFQIVDIFFFLHFLLCYHAYISFIFTVFFVGYFINGLLQYNKF